ncbi:MAG: hypothetical protein GDYSWBUE_000584 [Candidatus Fervidibacterota bacterium]
MFQNCPMKVAKMYCNSCGKLVPRGSKFCRHCGTRLDVPGAVTMLSDEFHMPHEKVQPQRAEQARSIFKQAFEASESGDINQAISLCKQAVALDPSYAPAHSLLGMLYERVGDKKAAYAEYEIALRLNPYSAADRDALKRLSKELGLPEVKLEQAPSLDPPHVRSLPLVAVTTFAIALIFLARAFYKPKQEVTHEVEVASVTTSVQPNLQQPGQATQDAKQMAQRLIVDAVTERERGNYDEALRLLYEALKLLPNDERIKKLIDETVEQKRERAKLAAQPQAPQSQSTPPARRHPSELPILPPPSIQPQSTQLSARQRTQPYQEPPQQTRVSTQPTHPLQPTQPQFTTPMSSQPYSPPYYTPSYPSYYVRPPTPPQAHPPVQQLTQQPIQQPEQPGEVEGGSGRIIVRAGGKVERPKQPSTPEQLPQEQQQIAVSPQVDVEELERKAMDLHLAGNLEAAIPLYIQALERNSDIAREGRLRQNLADAYRQSKRFKEAAREYRRAIEAYQRQLKMGIGDRSEIEIAIRACRQGLKMCE